jgi:hypothetical protein
VVINKIAVQEEGNQLPQFPNIKKLRSAQWPPYSVCQCENVIEYRPNDGQDNKFV